MNSPLQNTTLKTRQQIACEYGINYSTLRRWLMAAGIQLPRRMLSRRWQKCIYEKLGYPHEVDRRDFETVPDILADGII